MCTIRIPTFGKCKDSGKNDPNLTYIDADDCQNKDCKNPRAEVEYRKDESCCSSSSYDVPGSDLSSRTDDSSLQFESCNEFESTASICCTIDLSRYSQHVSSLPPYINQLLLFTHYNLEL